MFRWDLDHVARVDDWELLRGVAEGSGARLSRLDDLSSGTIVLLENLDRVVLPVEPSNRHAQDDFLALVDRVEEHLGMVFHRYLEDHPQPRLRIFINGVESRHRVHPWDPFLARHPATIATPVERIQSAAGLIEVQGFVLPHRDRLGDTAFEGAAGPEGWTAQQGFYVYRGRRLLLPGSWLGLGGGRAWTKEEPFKLARLRLDIPNSADAEWKIDVRKSNAEPPEFLKGRLRDLAEYVRNQARRVFAFRGSGDARAPGEVDRAWVVADGGRGERVRYRVNRKHPAVSQVLDLAGALAPAVEAMLQIVEDTVPVQRIWLDAVERGDVAAPIADGAEAAVEPIMCVVFAQLVEGDGLTPAEAKLRLLRTEPFQKFPQLVERLSSGSGVTGDTDAE